MLTPRYFAAEALSTLLCRGLLTSLSQLSTHEVSKPYTQKLQDELEKVQIVRQGL